MERFDKNIEDMLSLIVKKEHKRIITSRGNNPL
jgi:hypothetical protein